MLELSYYYEYELSEEVFLLYQEFIHSKMSNIHLFCFDYRAIGMSLARHERSDIIVVTGGFFGVGETISKSFLEERKRRNLSPNVWHILPSKDEQV